MENFAVLLVDDDKLTLRVVGQYIEKIGYEVRTAGGGREAIECFEEDPHRYRIIITDLAMPEMDGFDLIRAIRNRSPYVYPYISSFPVMVKRSSSSRRSSLERIISWRSQYRRGNSPPTSSQDSRNSPGSPLTFSSSFP